MDYKTSFQKCVLRWATAAAMGVILISAVGCGNFFGNNGGSGGGGGGGNNGGFTKASLNGHYAYTLRGIGTLDGVNSDLFVEGGVFNADGNGNITAGTVDFVANFQAFSDQVTGSYRINTDGSGDIEFDFPQGGFAIYHISMSDVSHFYMEHADIISSNTAGFATSGGSGEKQDTSAFTSIPSRTFVYQAHDLVSASARAGQMTWTSGNIAGTGDVLTGGGLVSPVTISGTALAPGTSTGRGTVTIIDDSGTNNYIYYVVNADKIRLLGDANALAIGQAEHQTGSPFSLASLNGKYVFGSAGETHNIDGIHSVGLFVTDGNGNVTTGNFDTVQDGTPVTNVSLSGTPSAYSMDPSTGRSVVTLHLSTGATNQKVLYLVSPSRAYFLVNDLVNVEDGTIDKQTGSSFSNSTMKGQYALLMDGFDANQQLPWRDRVGTWTPDGSGSVRTDYVAGAYLDSNPPQVDATINHLSGTYSVGSNGRATASINSLSSNLIFYMVSGNSGYMLQADNGVDIGGAITIQTKP